MKLLRAEKEACWLFRQLRDKFQYTEPLFRLHIVTVGNGIAVMSVLLALSVTIIGVLDHRTYTFDMK